MPSVKVHDWVPEATQRRIESFFENIDLIRQSLEKEKPPEWTQEKYRKYLKSKLWRTIRDRIWERDRKLCCRCGGVADAVHHRSYSEDVMLGKNDRQLASICEGCHTFIHFEDKGNKRTTEETDKLLLERNLSADFPTPKVDLRRKRNIEPSEWNRMSAVQRDAWRGEYKRLSDIRSTQRTREPRKTTRRTVS